MKNLTQELGHIVSHVAGSDIASGAVVVIGDRIAIANQAIASGATGSVQMEGVFELASVTNAAFSEGDQLYWNGSALSKIASANTPAGKCVEAKASSGATAKVRLSDHSKRAAFVADASSGSAAEINALRDALVAAGLMLNA